MIYPAVKIMKSLLLGAIAVYQKTLSLDHGILGRLVFGGVCRFSPTCSEYTRQAVSKYGVVKGLTFGVKRFLRCHPLAKGGSDPVP